MDPETSPHPPVVLYAVVLSWNRPADTLVCLDSLARQEGARVKLLVVDNGSTDDSVQIFREKFPQVEILENHRNLGFGAGINRGIRHAFESGADYVFIANNDAYLAPDAIAILLKYTGEQVGLIAPVIYYHSQPQVIWSLGNKTSRWNLEKIEIARGKNNSVDWPEIMEQDFITGCGVLIPRHIYERVGLFDERFRMYYEDADLCRSVKAAGYRILVIPHAKMWHKISTSSGGSDSPNERYWMAYSSILFFRKHAHGIQWPIVLIWRTSSAIRTSLRLLRKGRWQALKAYWQGLWNGLREREVANKDAI